MRSTFWQNRIFEHESCQFVTLASNSLQNDQTVRFSWKLYKTLFSGHAEHVLAKSHLWGWKLSKSSHWPQILSKTGKQCAFQENCRYCAARFSQIAFLSIKVVNSSHWPEILFKTAKQCAFHENCTKRSFQIMRSTFWQNRICEGENCQNRHTGLKFSSKRENSALFMKILGHAQHVLAKSHFWAPKLSIRHTGLKFSSKRPNSALFMKIVQNALFRSCAARFGQIKFVSVKLLKILTLVPNSLQNGKTVRFSWKLYKTLFSGHAEHVLAKSHLWEWKLSKSSHWPQILSKTGKQCAFHENCRSCAARFGKIAFLSTKVVNSSHWPEILFKTAKQCAFHENCTKRSFQVMRSTSWPNRICERQICQNCHTGLKFSPKRENSALFMKIVQNALLRSCAARFGQIKFVSVKVLKIVTLASNSLQNGKTGRVSWKLYKTLVSVLAKSHLWGSKLSKSSRWPPQNGQTVRFSWKLYKFLFSGHAEHVLAKSHFRASKLSKSLHLSQILFKTGKQCAFLENCTKRSFQVMRSTFWQNRICESESCQNHHTGLKFSPKRENSALFMKILGHAQHVLAKSHFWAPKLSIRHTGLKFSSKRPNSALFMKIVQNALFRSCAARFGQIKFVSVKLLKILTLVPNSLQNGKTVRFSWKLYKTLFSGHAEHVLPKSHLWEWKLSKSSHWPQILSKTGKQCAFHENCRSCAARFGKIAFLSTKVVNSSHWPQILFKTTKQCAFHENCTKRSFQVMRSTFWQNRICEGESCQNRHTGLKFSPKRANSALFRKIVGIAQHVLAKSHFWASKLSIRHTGLKFSSKRPNSALSMKIVQNALFRSCAARFGKIAFVRVKVVKIVTLASNSLQNGKTVRFSWNF